MTLVAPDEKIDWFRVIVDLERSGYSYASIGAAIGAARSTVIGWKQGSSPTFESGDLLIELWMSVLRKSRDSVHTVKRNSFLA